MMTNQQPKRLGFHLVELLVVIAIIGILTGLLMSAVQRVRAAASKIACVNHLHQIGLAFHQYHDSYGVFPTKLFGANQGIMKSISWPTRILPFIEQENLYGITLEAYQEEPIAFLNPPHTGLTTVIKVFTCPDDGRLSSPITDDLGYSAAYGSYSGVLGGFQSDGIFGRSANGCRISDITDGTSNTLMIGELPPYGKYFQGSWYSIWIPDEIVYYNLRVSGGISSQFVYRTKDINHCQAPFYFGPGRIENPCDSLHFWSLHSGGANFVLGDGSVRFIPYSAEPLMIALATKAGGEIVEVP